MKNEITHIIENILKMKKVFYEDIKFLAGDASNRKYFIIKSQNRDRVLMYDNNPESLKKFVKISNLLSNKVTVPKIFLKLKENNILIIENFGDKKFIRKCKASGVDGLIVVDLSFPDNKNFAKLCKKNSICFVQLIAPTTTVKRMKEIIKSSHEMIYMISTISTTGSALKYSIKRIIKNFNVIKKIKPSKNVVIGFGITEKTISNLRSADGLVVGSAICREITRSLKDRQNPVTNVSKLVRKLKNKII